MGSKYDGYWAARLEHIRAAVELAAAGGMATVDIPGPRRLGDRQSWHGVAEVRGRDPARAESAHVVSLGKIIAASDICEP